MWTVNPRLQKHMQHLFSYLKMYSIAGAALPIVEIENEIRIVYCVFSFFYCSVADENKEDPMIYGVTVAALLPFAAYWL